MCVHIAGSLAAYTFPYEISRKECFLFNDSGNTKSSHRCLHDSIVHDHALAESFEYRLGLNYRYCSFILPLVIWLMRGYFESVPKDLEEVARIDGCSRIGVIFRIVLPLSTPGLCSKRDFCFYHRLE